MLTFWDMQWSKSVYAYYTAVCLLEIGGKEERKEGIKLMKEVPKLRQKIAGKSIPLEVCPGPLPTKIYATYNPQKFVARKARKFLQQGDRLALPLMELSYFSLSIARAPGDVIEQKMLPLIYERLDILKAHESKTGKYEGGHGYWDDYCLARFLEGCCIRYAAYPVINLVFAFPRNSTTSRIRTSFLTQKRK